MLIDDNRAYLWGNDWLNLPFIKLIILIFCHFANLHIFAPAILNMETCSEHPQLRTGAQRIGDCCFRTQRRPSCTLFRARRLTPRPVNQLVRARCGHDKNLGRNKKGPHRLVWTFTQLHLRWRRYADGAYIRSPKRPS